MTGLVDRVGRLTDERVILVDCRDGEVDGGVRVVVDVEGFGRERGDGIGTRSQLLLLSVMIVSFTSSFRGAVSGAIDGCDASESKGRGGIYVSWASLIILCLLFDAAVSCASMSCLSSASSESVTY